MHGQQNIKNDTCVYDFTSVK